MVRMNMVGGGGHCICSPPRCRLSLCMFPASVIRLYNMLILTDILRRTSQQVFFFTCANGTGSVSMQHSYWNWPTGLRWMITGLLFLCMNVPSVSADRCDSTVSQTCWAHEGQTCDRSKSEGEAQQPTCECCQVANGVGAGFSPLWPTPRAPTATQNKLISRPTAPSLIRGCVFGWSCNNRPEYPPSLSLTACSIATELLMLPASL